MEQNGLNFCKDTVSRNSLIENKLINTLMFHGKKKASKRLLSVLYKNISKKTKKKIVSILICSLLNCLPILSVKTLRNKNRKKTSHRYIPFFIKKNYRTRSAIKVLLNKHQIKKIKSLQSESLCNHFLNWSKFDNTSLKNKDEAYKIVFANKKFANYRWF